MNFTAKNNCFSEVDLENIRNKSSLNDLFLNSDSFIIAYYISLVEVQTNYCNNNLLILDVKQINKIMKLCYFRTLKAL